jgi:hypothetical protein
LWWPLLDGSFVLPMCWGMRRVPGLAPADDLLFFASPKKSKQKKGEPKSGPLRGALRCSHLAGAGGAMLNGFTRGWASRFGMLQCFFGLVESPHLFTQRLDLVF